MEPRQSPATRATRPGPCAALALALAAICLLPPPASQAAEDIPAPATGWWWNPTEGGRGFTIEQQGSNMFMAGYLYDASGRATWVAAGPTPMDGAVFTSTLTEYRGGQTLNGSYHLPTSTSTAGPISIRFTDANHGTLTWAGGTVAIERYDIVPGGAAAAQAAGAPEPGWWWNEAEGGRGFSIEVQQGTLFLAGYMYDDDGAPVWYASGPAAIGSAGSYLGQWQQYGNGQTLSGPYKPANIVNAKVGDLAIRFSSRTSGTLTLPNGGQIPIVRYRFASSVGAGWSAAPTSPAVATVAAGASLPASSSKLAVSWGMPDGAVPDHYVVSASETIGNTTRTFYVPGGPVAGKALLTATMTGLKSSTTYNVTVTACKDGPCSVAASTAAGSGKTNEEVWQLQGSGASIAGLAKVVSDGNVRIAALRYGADAPDGLKNRIQLYYGPSVQQGASGLVTALSNAEMSEANPSSATAASSFTSAATSSGIHSPITADTLIKQVNAGQAVPLSAAAGGKVRLYFEANGVDGRARIFSVDSRDGYIGKDFNGSSSATVCKTAADYAAGGGCTPTVEVAVESDAGGNPKIANARQLKIGYPTQDDWRWNQSPGAFMAFTVDNVPGCGTARTNHAYAQWDGARWVVQYDAAGCPKLFQDVQAATPQHLGGTRYKMYYGVNTETTGRVSTSRLPFPGPKKVIYADGTSTGSSATVEFEDWEPVSAARGVSFLWPDGTPLNATAEGYIDDFMVVAPTNSLNFQVNYLAITDGFVPPFATVAVLQNP